MSHAVFTHTDIVNRTRTSLANMHTRTHAGTWTVVCQNNDSAPKYSRCGNQKALEAAIGSQCFSVRTIYLGWPSCHIVTIAAQSYLTSFFSLNWMHSPNRTLSKVTTYFLRRILFAKSTPTTNVILNSKQRHSVGQLDQSVVKENRKKVAIKHDWGPMNTTIVLQSKWCI